MCCIVSGGLASQAARAVLHSTGCRLAALQQLHWPLVLLAGECAFARRMSAQVGVGTGVIAAQE